MTTSLERVLPRLREKLHALEYTESRIASAIGLGELGKFTDTQRALYRYNATQTDPRLATVVRLFLLEDPIPLRDLGPVLEPTLVSDLIDVGVLTPPDGGSTRSDYLLSPIDGAWVFTDLRSSSRSDRVPPLGRDAYTLADQIDIPDDATVLDIGTPSSVHGVLAARRAKRVLCINASERALDLARISSILAGVHGRMDMRRGVMFEALGDEKFDIIIGNPPFLLHPRQALVLRDAQSRGVEILEEILSEAPRHLESVGSLHVVTEVVYRDETPVAERVESWSESKLRGVIFEEDSDFLRAYLQEHAHRRLGQSLAPEALDRQEAEYQTWLYEMNISKITHATMHLQPHGVQVPRARTTREVVTVPVGRLRSVGRDHVLAAHRSTRGMVRPDWFRSIKSHRIRFDPDLVISSQWSPHLGQELVKRVEFSRTSPWRQDKLEPWEAELLVVLGRSETVGDWIERCSKERGADASPDVATLENFLRRAVSFRWVSVEAPPGGPPQDAA